MLHLILKAATSCNSNCLYCDDRIRGGAGEAMSLEVAETVFARVNEFLAAHPAETVDLLWHGGEPLLLGPEYYLRIAAIEQMRCADTRDRIRHGMQTNLTCLEENFIPALRLLRIDSVGTSYDPKPHVRGGGPDRDSETYARRFLRGLSILDRHSIGWGLLYVVARHSLADPLAVFHTLTNLRLGGTISLNPVLSTVGGEQSFVITPEEFVQFLGALFPYWQKHRARFPHVEPFASLLNGVEAGTLGPDVLALGVCDTQPDRLAIAPDGKVRPGGWSDGSADSSIGTVVDRSFDELSASSGFREMRKAVEDLRADACGPCRLARACQGTDGAFVVPGPWCRARVGFVEQYLNPLVDHRVEHAKQSI